MPKVLVVEDSNVLQMYYRQIFAKLAGYQVTFTKNGRQALDHIEKNGMPDVVVLDINMPVMDGLEFLGHFRGDRKTPPGARHHRDHRRPRGRLQARPRSRRERVPQETIHPRGADRAAAGSAREPDPGRGQDVSQADAPAPSQETPAHRVRSR